jgi:hypothetical protein
VSEDACAAIVDLAGKQIPGVSRETRQQALQTASDKSKNEETRNRAHQALARLR